MKKISKYKLKKISKNLDYFFNLANDNEVKQGLNWYKEANNKVIEISKKYYIDVFKVAQVVSALSPRNKWERNLQDAETVCKAFKEGKGFEDVKVCTFTKNKIKAFRILDDKIQITDKSLKTYNFVNNIAYPNNNNFLTVDIWHLRACFNKSIKIDGASIGRIAYGQIKELTTKKALKLGINPCKFQAIIWITTQNNLTTKEL